MSFHQLESRIQSNKSKYVPLPPCWSQGGEEYGKYSFLTLALGGMSGQRDALAAVYPRGKKV
jgi:hypothetical protein